MSIKLQFATTLEDRKYEKPFRKHPWYYVIKIVYQLLSQEIRVLKTRLWWKTREPKSITETQEGTRKFTFSL